MGKAGADNSIQLMRNRRLIEVVTNNLTPLQSRNILKIVVDTMDAVSNNYTSINKRELRK